jgi:hypothetical protein
MATALKASDENEIVLADGIKELLGKFGLNRSKILSYSAGEISSLLNIDEYVAILILNAAKSASVITP